MATGQHPKAQIGTSREVSNQSLKRLQETTVRQKLVNVSMKLLLLIPLAIMILACMSQGIDRFKGFLTESPTRDDKVVKTDAEWKQVLTPEQYRVLRKKGTEAAFCSPLLDNHEKGAYHCAGCGLKLFKTDAKFDSGTGWPSFFQPESKEAIWLKQDVSHGMVRMEVLCSRCDGHLGHVFEDGPKPTGLRFCMNGEALNFRKA